jgi:hypothetical protein
LGECKKAQNSLQEYETKRDSAGCRGWVSEWELLIYTGQFLERVWKRLKGKEL